MISFDSNSHLKFWLALSVAVGAFSGKAIFDYHQKQTDRILRVVQKSAETEAVQRLIREAAEARKSIGADPLPTCPTSRSTDQDEMCTTRDAEEALRHSDLKEAARRDLSTLASRRDAAYVEREKLIAEWAEAREHELPVVVVHALLVAASAIFILLVSFRLTRSRTESGLKFPRLED